MIRSVDGLALPPSVDCVSELVNRDYTTQTVSGRLVTNLDPQSKWKITVSFKSFALDQSLQAAFYAKCFAMRTQAAEIVFVSAYDNSIQTITARCIEIITPEIFGISQRQKKPSLYGNIGAVFQEV